MRRPMLFSLLAATSLAAASVAQAAPPRADAKSWSNAEVEQLIKQIKSGKAKCVMNQRTRVTLCDVD